MATGDDVIGQSAGFGTEDESGGTVGFHHFYEPRHDGFRGTDGLPAKQAAAPGRCSGHKNAIFHRITEILDDSRMVENIFAMGGHAACPAVGAFGNGSDQDQVRQSEVTHDPRRRPEVPGINCLDQDHSAMVQRHDGLGTVVLSPSSARGFSSLPHLWYSGTFYARQAGKGKGHLLFGQSLVRSAQSGDNRDKE